MSEQRLTSLSRGAALIRKKARMLPDTPGVYRMIDDKGNVLYVGKAKSLKKRVSSYARTARHPVRTKRMVALTVDMEFVHTHTEIEALILEANLIKKFKPPYNILLKDDKSFPYIFISGDHDFPLLAKHRGPQKRKGRYHGPYADARSVYKTLIALQKAFMIRNCTDAIFSARTRPCLQYHIKRCTAPCVNYVTKEEYAQQIAQAEAFLKGQSSQIQQELAEEMQKASKDMDYERAAALRDRIKALTAVQARQDIVITLPQDADVIGMAREGDQTCVQIFFFRSGRNLGNKPYFPEHSEDQSDAEIMAAFISQFYSGKSVPALIYVSAMPQESALLQSALETQREGAGVRIIKPARGEKKRIVEFAEKNASDALVREIAKNQTNKSYLEKIAEVFEMAEAPKRIEVYDNSHISGTNMVGAMIVAGVEGFRKNAYRKFNIRQAAAGDDYAMMREVMKRRFGGAMRAGRKKGDEDWPDLVLIDGGKGQLSSVIEIMNELGLGKDDVRVVSIAKGEDRNAGRETFFMTDGSSFDMPVNDPALHYLQRLRDEAHRFAIGAHRTRRQKQIYNSPLDEIEGVGAKRKKALLLHFGSAKAVQDAGIQDIMAVEGISKAVAEKIYSHFHEQ